MAEVPHTFEEFIKILDEAVNEGKLTALSHKRLKAIAKYPAMDLIEDAEITEASGFGDPLDSLEMEHLRNDLETLFGFRDIIGEKMVTMVDIYCLLRDNS